MSSAGATNKVNSTVMCDVFLKSSLIIGRDVIKLVVKKEFNN
jgi:hypothetical protein